MSSDQFVVVNSSGSRVAGPMSESEANAQAGQLLTESKKNESTETFTVKKYLAG